VARCCRGVGLREIGVDDGRRCRREKIWLLESINSIQMGELTTRCFCGTAYLEMVNLCRNVMMGYGIVGGVWVKRVEG
jgi:hypothetical protein